MKGFIEITRCNGKKTMLKVDQIIALEEEDSKTTIYFKTHGYSITSLESYYEIIKKIKASEKVNEI